MQVNAEIFLAQAPDRFAQQGDILPYPSAQSDLRDPGSVSQAATNLYDHLCDGIVEPGRNDWRRNTCLDILSQGPEQRAWIDDSNQPLG